MVVSNTSPIANLAAIGHLHLLRELYGTILLLMDERRSRRIASRLGLRPIGLLGVILEAKSKNLTPTVRPLLDARVTQAGFWISRSLYDRVLDEAAE